MLLITSFIYYIFLVFQLWKEDEKATKGDWAFFVCCTFAKSFKQREWQTDNLSFFNHLNFNNYGFRVCSNKKSVRF